MLKISIIDGYIDEPTCLGIPPYISPYPRYIAGSILDFNDKANISYFTIDQIRNNIKNLDFISRTNIVITIAGTSVPGRYLSGYPASPNELVSIMKNLKKPIKILCGPAAKHGFGMTGGKKTKDTDFIKDFFDLIIKGDEEIVISQLINSNINLEAIDPNECRKNASIIRNYAIKGANIVKKHPNFPDYIITEIETYKGCPRSIVGGCSFCSEPFKGPPNFRPSKDVIDEIKALYENGIRHFRIGNQPCIFSYMSKDADKEEFPKPNPEALEKLFKGIRKVAPDLKTLHIDNANPGILSRYPNECKKIAKTIIKYHTPGDVAAFGVESVDPLVIEKNNLKASSEEVLSAIKLLNEVGSKRGINGMPELLPGINFVFGLEGETKKTYEENYFFLKKILDENLLIRRINLRQIITIPGTKMYNIGSKIISKNKHLFKKFKRKIKEEIEKPMLKKLIPFETVLKEVYTEKHNGKLTYARQVGSYPILIGIPGVLDLKKFLDVKIVDYGYRSITGVPFPLDINIAQMETLISIPGIGQKRALRIFANRPFKNKEQLIDCLDDIDVTKKFLNFVNINQ